MTVIKNSFSEWSLCYAYEFLISILSSLSLYYNMHKIMPKKKMLFTDINT